MDIKKMNSSEAKDAAKKTLPKEFYERIDKIVNNQQSSRQLFEEALAIAREKGFSDFEIELSIKEYLLKEKQIPKSTFYRYFAILKPKPALAIDMEQSSIQSVPMGKTKDDSIIDEMPDEIYDKALSIGLSEEKLTMIANANRRLKDHPHLQKDLIQDIKDVSNDEAKVMVAQTVSEVETGYYEKVGNEGHYVIHDSQREKISLKEPVVQPPFLRLLDIEAATTKLLFNLTDHKLGKKEYDYTEQIIKNSAGFMLSVIKTSNFTGVIALEQSLNLIKFATDQALKMIKEERKSREEKKDLTSE